MRRGAFSVSDLWQCCEVFIVFVVVLVRSGGGGGMQWPGEEEDHMAAGQRGKGTRPDDKLTYCERSHAVSVLTSGR